ncbi:helix-turn-helix domain-containing protein [Ramlibacter tataouinensis]|uniref:Transcriptional regulator, AraC family-like protein n=1 Tax=Ramlibacter tataouinensis (strain ATCC BAA-407 / DSM 14655 / LMG 21543 / TTB310) TaxID=365046 RepID=F5Y402_RAMTT|nr:helix-turn-helix domain-containing protein [Ramlibacter tataouinensis]AEG91280.1 transcriptional regulator, AraC family-like protein [Ramlibacter tataouinensis TTB310]
MNRRLYLRLPDDPVYAPETDVPAGRLCELRVHEGLASRVAHVVAYRDEIALSQVVEEQVVPDGALRLVVQRQGAAWSTALVGATLAPVVLQYSGRIEGLSITFRPGAAAGLLQVDAAELAGRAVSPGELWGADGRELEGLVAGAAGLRALSRQLQAFLLRRLPPGESLAQARVRHAAGLIARGTDAAPAQVARALEISERRLQQLFSEHLGVSPQAWRRLSRVHGCLRELRRQPDPDWPGFALAMGFYDQAHLINEFRAFCGETPARFQARLGRSVADFSKTAA